MSSALPPVSEVRSRIESVEHEGTRNCLKTTLLLCARIGEVVAYKLESDTETQARGNLLNVKETTYTPNLYNEKEIQTLMLTAMVQGKNPNLQQLSKIKEPAAVFQVSTHKRLGMIRECALPLNPEYEPWTQTLVDYFKRQREGPAFPFNRQQMWTVANEAFQGLTYKIMGYKKVVGYEVVEGKKKAIKEVVPEHMRIFALQALRHLRGSELRNFYNFDGADRSAYGGWTLRTTEGVSGSQDRYVELPWRSYFPKLLRKREGVL